MLRSALRILGKTWQLTSIVSIWRINMKNVAPQNQTQRLSLFNKAVPGDLRDLVPRNQKVCTLTSGSLSLPANMEPFAFWGMHVILNCSEHINQTWLGLEHNELVPAGIKIIKQVFFNPNWKNKEGVSYSTGRSVLDNTLHWCNIVDCDCSTQNWWNHSWFTR